MNVNKLIRLESDFLLHYPQGFNSKEMIEIRKKHNLNKVSSYLKKVCSKENLKLGLSVYDDVIKVVSRSSMVSVFEKMKFIRLNIQKPRQNRRGFLLLGEA